MNLALHSSEIRLRIVEAVLPRLNFPSGQRTSELLDALRDIEAWVLGVETISGSEPALSVTASAELLRQAEPIESAPPPAPAREARRLTGPSAEQRTFDLLAEIAKAGEPLPSNP